MPPPGVLSALEMFSRGTLLRLGKPVKSKQPARVSAFHGGREATGSVGPQAVVSSLPTGTRFAHLVRGGEAGDSGPPVSCKRL